MPRTHSSVAPGLSGQTKSSRSLGAEVLDLDSADCFSLLDNYIKANPEIWREGIGEE